MKPRIAIPIPTSFDPEYNLQNWRAYAEAIAGEGAEPVKIPLDVSPRAVAELSNSCQAVLLPGSPADLNPSKYGQVRQETTARADEARENVDELLLQDAHNLYKPLLGICFGAQTLNVWRSGTLVQDLTTLPVNHRAGRSVGVAHPVLIPRNSLLASVVDPREAVQDGEYLRLPVNSSHHQAISASGDGLRICGRCPQDGVVEAIEGPQHLGALHFVLGLQWHPERTYAESSTSRAIFRRLSHEAASWFPRRVTTSVSH